MSHRYRLYVDESGDHVFHDDAALSDPAHRYLALLGCWFRNDDYLPFHQALTELKQRHFPHNPDDPLVLHRADIINARGPFWRLRDTITRSAFDHSLLLTISNGTFRVVIVVIDKQVLKQNHASPWHPYHLALGFLLQRYCGYLNHMNAAGDVVAESRGRRENRLLQNEYAHIYAHGDTYHLAEWFQRALTSKDIKLKPKTANISGLQLADVLAHPLKEALLLERGLVEGPIAPFASRLAEAVGGKFNRHLYDGGVEGYGKVFFPQQK